MEFKDKKGIYLQIAENMMDRFLEEYTGQTETDSAVDDPRIPSIRETAEELGVNPNTVMRSYSFLQDLGIIYNKRGIGFFLSPDGSEKALNWKRDEFVRVELPEVFRTMKLLDMNPGDLIDLYKEYEIKEGNNEAQ